MGIGSFHRFGIRRNIRDVLSLHDSHQTRSVLQTAVFSVGRYGSFKNPGSQYIAQIRIGDVLTLDNQRLVHLFLILRPCIQPGQTCFQLIQQLILFTDFSIQIANLRENTALLHRSGIGAFVNHRDALDSLTPVASVIHKALGEASLPQGFVDSIGSCCAPDFCLSTIIPIHNVFLMGFEAALLLGRYAIAICIKLVDQPALWSPAPVLLNGAHGQHDMNVGIAVALVMKGNISAHALIHEGFLDKFANQSDVLVVGKLRR